ncbi:MAG: cryptochrome/photolyase family protein [Anderseniella sp.]|nr:cryptochrome/photolyase family protein [Anderseniella sp.]
MSIILVLGDQLTCNLSSLAASDPSQDVVLMAEVIDEATYVRHHKKKLAFVFSAMRHFAQELREAGWQVDYVKLDDDGNAGSLKGEVERAIQRHQADHVRMTEAGEWRLKDDVASWADDLGVEVEVLEDDRFICSHDRFRRWASDRKSLRMEYFYREMRRDTGLLVDEDGEPEGGQWNYDQDNRKPAGQDMFMPKPLQFEPDDITRDVMELVASRFEDNFGDLEPFCFAVTRADAEAALDHFIDEALACFGDYQDAMLEGEDYLYHSVLSPYINIGLLDPLDVCKRVVKAYEDGKAPLNAVEGFVRQIIGWREYVRGIYWLKMPDYAEENFFEAERPLPAFYWTGETDMACLAAAIGQTKRLAYAHHIQRLMVTGNFAMLAGVRPQAVHEWYLIVYADAYEWVELPNTLGMSQFGDGGLLASKPYASSGNYINKMSDHCKGCSYSVSKKTGEGACPFNALYWDFLARNRGKLDGNPRMGQMFATWDRMGDDKKKQYRDSARAFLDALEWDDGSWTKTR